MTLGTYALAAVLALEALGMGGASGGPAYGTYQWPVHGRVIRGFEPPSDPYGPGHRGIDIAAPFGSPMVASQEGVVAFAGWVGGSLFISIDHPDGVRTTYSWLSATQVKKGDTVARGSLIGSTGHGHPGVDPPHLHFGARIGADYIDPMLLLEGADVSGLIHLAPLPDAPQARTGPSDVAPQPDRSWSGWRRGRSPPPSALLQWPGLADRPAVEGSHLVRVPVGGVGHRGRCHGCPHSSRGARRGRPNRVPDPAS